MECGPKRLNGTSNLAISFSVAFEVVNEGSCLVLKYWYHNVLILNFLDVNFMYNSMCFSYFSWK